MVDEMMLIHDMMIDDGWDRMMINEMILYKLEKDPLEGGLRPLPGP